MSELKQYLATPSFCENSSILEISNVLDNFFGKISGAVGSANDFVDEIRETAGLITDITQGIAGQMTLFLEDSLVGFIETALGGVKAFFFSLYATNPLLALAQTKAFNGAALKPIQRLFNTFECLGSTIAKSMFKTIEDMLVNAVKKGIVNPVVCAVEDFVGGITNQITNTINSALDSFISPINKLFGLIPNFSGFNLKDRLAGFNNAFRIAGNVLKCIQPGTAGGSKGCPDTKTYELNKGATKPKSEQEQKTIFENAFNKGQSAVAGINTSLSKFEQNIGTWGIFGSEDGEARDPIECNTGNVFECGPPRLEFFGGDGEGAAGDIILGNFIENFVEEIQDVEGINREINNPLFRFNEPFEGQEVIDTASYYTGSIIGVNITYPGRGYTEEPIVSLVDRCDQGYGAFGRAKIDKDPNSPTFGQVIDVIITSQGENYPVGELTEAYVREIIVEEGGINYTENDVIDDFEICGLDENGSITKVCTNNRAYKKLPNLSVKSVTGTGARLKAVMTSKPRETGVINVIDCITPKGNIVGYVNGKEYNGPFHVHPTTGQKMVGIAHTTSGHATIYPTPQESLRTGGTSSLNVGSTRVNTRSIQDLIQESETTQSNESSGDSTPPSTPPSSGGSGSGGGY
tara:strand:- start:464 stop:2362 length:1899 start_codon:yes stop_codon:yes gene_type:complete